MECFCCLPFLAKKGFLDYEGTNLHTCMQSDDINCHAGKAAQFRAQDLDAWRKFIDARRIPKNELVIMAGDFNTHRDTPEFMGSLVTR